MPVKKKRVMKKKSTGNAKRTVRRAPARRTSSTAAMKHPVVSARSDKDKVNLIFKNLVLFAILFILFLVLYYVTTDEVYQNLFWILAVLMGFVAVAFLIVLLVFVFMRLFRKV